jgi:hypothetical protein
MRNTTLVYSSKWYSRDTVLVLDLALSDAGNRLINSIFRLNVVSQRVSFKNNRYRYFPSEEYKNFVVRIRKIR